MDNTLCNHASLSRFSVQYILDDFSQLQELAKIRRFPEIMNGGVFLSSLLIRRRVRRAHDDNCDLAASFGCTYLPQNFLTVKLRQREVKQKKIRTGEMRSAIKVREKRKDRRDVSDHAKLATYLVLF
jgi:hypothetical protein